MSLTQQARDQISRLYAETYIDVRNNTGSTINALTVVKVNGDYSTTEIPTVTAVTSTTDMPVALLVSNLITATNTSHPSSSARALRRGRIQATGLNTTASALNAPVYFTTAGALTLTGGSVPIGIVLTLATNGVIYVDIPVYASGGSTFASVSSNTTLSTSTTEVTGGTAFTLPAAGTVGKRYRVINASTSSITISSSSTIGNKNSGNPTSLVLKTQEWLDVYDTGTNWRIV